MRGGVHVRGYVHAAVGEGERVRVAGHALLLAVVGAGGGSHGVTRGGGGLSAGRQPAKTAALFVGGGFRFGSIGNARPVSAVFPARTRPPV